ncbi:nucleotidyl transferase AbiEii/AbiGii toxin family protein [Mycoavidus sp. B2-EB]|uniref:nucleotidyl transferase AbiEii/AbiGii toxin family protein n=1 Tax=Mycoavidus sp. B2-EB TaxID=2651972 RepID=UPI00162A0B54|nr:nucleotidyl transferase AbiEii/AbiGii toxin family protein [Mycoavidus sp. B2-EB]BBO60173.1 hypothetical protein MPB2EB_1312 [Mycoavidus sp. B2-EB]
MPKSFLHLSPTEQSQILRGLAAQLSRAPNILEKDVWVCWVLQALFTMPDRLPMAFKGGTSLSKVFGAIARFSEDVDITLDYRGLDGVFDPFAKNVSKTRLKKFSDELKIFVRDHVHHIIAPYFHKKLTAEFNPGSYKVTVSDDGEQLRVYYPTVFETPGSYIGNSVLIEFGGRNITEPNEEHEVQPDIAKHIAALDCPYAQVKVLSPMRTFWEKATLMHVECQRGEFRSNSERLSRHWYDLAMLANLAIGQNALADRGLLADVIKHKKVFYNTSYANYDACLVGQLRLLPNETALPALRQDFQSMIGAGMFIGNPPSFDTIIDCLRALEKVINKDGRK